MPRFGRLTGGRVGPMSPAREYPCYGQAIETIAARITAGRNTMLLV